MSMHDDDFIKYGRELFVSGLNNSHSGNMSVLDGNNICITRHGSQLGALKASDIVCVNLNDTKKDNLASVEIVVHRAIYKMTGHSAIVHAHSPATVALSFTMEEIVPQDEEGKFYFRSIPVIVTKDSIGSQEVARLAAPILKDGKIVVVRGHGVFSASDNLEHAYQWVSSLEHSAKILVYKKIIEMGR